MPSWNGKPGGASQQNGTKIEKINFKMYASNLKAIWPGYLKALLFKTNVSPTYLATCSLSIFKINLTNQNVWKMLVSKIVPTRATRTRIPMTIPWSLGGKKNLEMTGRQREKEGKQLCMKKELPKTIKIDKCPNMFPTCVLIILYLYWQLVLIRFTCRLGCNCFDIFLLKYIEEGCGFSETKPRW